MAVAIGATLIVCLLIFVASQSLWWTALGFLIPLLTRDWVVRTLARRRKLFAEQLPDASR